ncbi:hypothetical protein FB451DRAFT_1410093 [Mycena latifolia]|nr:hypothetical protein FB451DRAFT_1410093 [Mycena latifolia]
MFQVASHPALFAHHQHAARLYDAPMPPAVTLPRTLARPQFTDVSRDALAAAAPELAAVPAKFIRHDLRAKAPQMLAGIQALAPSHVPQALPRSHLPPALTVPLRASAGPLAFAILHAFLYTHRLASLLPLPRVPRAPHARLAHRHPRLALLTC